MTVSITVFSSKSFGPSFFEKMTQKSWGFFYYYFGILRGDIVKYRVVTYQLTWDCSQSKRALIKHKV